MRRFPDRDRVEMGSEREASDHTGGSATDGNPVRSGDKPSGKVYYL